LRLTRRQLLTADLVASILWQCYKVYRPLHSSLEWNLCRVFRCKAVGHPEWRTSNKPHSCLFCGRRKHFHASTWGGCDIVCFTRLVSNYFTVLWKELRPIWRVEALLLRPESPHLQKIKQLPTGRTMTPGFGPSRGEAARATRSLA
jgi:hypothetical protein